ncbi:MAG TPA: hypothetical protein VGA99_15545 [bacterium]
MATRNNFASIIFALVATTLGLNCSTKGPSGLQDNVVTIRLNLVYPGENSFARRSKLTAIDRVLISVTGFDDLNERTIAYIESQELNINTSDNVAEGTISIPLGEGTPVTQTVGEEEITGELILIDIDMFENDTLIFTGTTPEFFVAPGTIVDSPPIFLTGGIVDGQGNSIGTVTVSPNPAVAFSTIHVQLDITAQLSSNGAAAVTLLPRNTTLDLIDNGGGQFSLDFPGNALGRLTLQFGFAEIEGGVFGGGTSFVDLFVDRTETGFGRDITLAGDFEIAIGSENASVSIIWTEGDPDGEIRANHLTIEDITAQPTPLWEITSLDTTLFNSGIFLGRLPAGAGQDFPPDDLFPQFPQNGNRYRIIIDGVQGNNDVSAQTEFTFQGN